MKKRRTRLDQPARHCLISGRSQVTIVDEEASREVLGEVAHRSSKPSKVFHERAHTSRKAKPVLRRSLSVNDPIAALRWSRGIVESQRGGRRGEYDGSADRVCEIRCSAQICGEILDRVRMGRQNFVVASPLMVTEEIGDKFRDARKKKVVPRKRHPRWSPSSLFPPQPLHRQSPDQSTWIRAGYVESWEPRVPDVINSNVQDDQVGLKCEAVASHPLKDLIRVIAAKREIHDLNPEIGKLVEKLLTHVAIDRLIVVHSEPVGRGATEQHNPQSVVRFRTHHRRTPVPHFVTRGNRSGRVRLLAVRTLPIPVVSVGNKSNLVGILNRESRAETTAQNRISASRSLHQKQGQHENQDKREATADAGKRVAHRTSSRECLQLAAGALNVPPEKRRLGKRFWFRSNISTVPKPSLWPNSPPTGHGIYFASLAQRCARRTAKRPRGS